MEIPKLGYRVASVKFPFDDRIVDFRLYDSSVIKDDYVLTRKDRGGVYNDTVGRIVNIHDSNDDVRGEVICKIDYSVFNERQGYEERIEGILKVLYEKENAFDLMKIYEFIATEDDEVKALLDEYNALKEKCYV